MQDHLAGGFQSKCGVHPSIGPAECAAEDLALREARIKIPQQSHLKNLQIRIERGYLCVLKVEPDSGQGIEALEKRFFRREAQGRERLVADFNGVTQRTLSLVHVKVIDFDRGLRLNDRFCVNSDASIVFASRDGNSQEVVGVSDRADIT